MKNNKFLAVLISISTTAFYGGNGANNGYGHGTVIAARSNEGNVLRMECGQVKEGIMFYAGTPKAFTVKKTDGSYSLENTWYDVKITFSKTDGAYTYELAWDLPEGADAETYADQFTFTLEDGAASTNTEYTKNIADNRMTVKLSGVVERAKGVTVVEIGHYVTGKSTMNSKSKFKVIETNEVSVDKFSIGSTSKVVRIGGTGMKFGITSGKVYTPYEVTLIRAVYDANGVLEAVWLNDYSNIDDCKMSIV